MLDTQEITTCRACGKPIIQAPGGHRVRVYCNAACKMRDRRRLQSEKRRIQETDTTQKQVAALQARVRELESRLIAIQDVNERFRNDTRVRAFAPWLEKRAEYYAVSSFGQRFLADCGERLLPPSASRSNYERIMRYTLKYSDEDLEMFREAWREMLKTQF